MNHSEFDIKDYPETELRGGNNRFLTEGLFYEYGNPDALYTMKTEDVQKDGKVYVSMYKVYMTCADEYEAANRLLGSQQHWAILSSKKFFLEGIERFNGGYGLELWREDMKRRDESLSKRILISKTEEGNVNAAKALADQHKAKKSETKKSEQKELQKDEADLFSGFHKAKQGIDYVN